MEAGAASLLYPPPAFRKECAERNGAPKYPPAPAINRTSPNVPLCPVFFLSGISKGSFISQSISLSL